MYIVLEGIDGSGKSTHAKILADSLGAVHVVEPSDFAIGKLIRERIREGQVEPAVMTRLFAADRHDLAAKVIEPALEQGQVVVSDRNVISSLVYQADGDMTVEAVWDINMKAGSLPTPDLVVVIDVPVVEAARRLKTGREQVDAFETDARLTKHYGRYRKLGEFVRWPVVYVDGTADLATVAERVRTAVDAVLDR